MRPQGVSRFRSLCLGLCLLLATGIVMAAVEARKIDMFVGEIQVLENMNVERVAVGNGKLLRVRLLKNGQMLIIAEKDGSTTVHLWHKDGRETDLNVRISKTDPQMRVRLEKMIYMDVKIVEFRKQALDELGIDWQKSVAGPVFAGAGDLKGNDLFRSTPSAGIFNNLPNTVEPFRTYFGIATEITSRLNFLASNGDAYLLAQPKLSCMNGGKAKFLAGGEVPLPVQNSLGQTQVTFKEYGVILEINPLADESGVIAAKINTEVSTIDPSVTVLGIPGFLTRKTATEMNVREGETIVISGLLNHESSKDVNRIPWLGDLPILGALFRSTRFQNKQSELVVFVTPRIFDARSSVSRDQIERAEREIGKRKKALEERLEIGIVD